MTKRERQEGEKERNNNNKLKKNKNVVNDEACILGSWPSSPEGIWPGFGEQ